MYWWLKDESYAPPVTLLSRRDGTATAYQAEMDGLLQDAWRPINPKYAVDPKPDPAAAVIGMSEILKDVGLPTTVPQHRSLLLWGVQSLGMMGVAGLSQDRSTAPGM